MKFAVIFGASLCVTLVVGCGGSGDSSLFGSGGAPASSSGHGGAVSVVSSSDSSSSSVGSSSSAESSATSSSAAPTSSSSSGGGFFWASGVQQNVDEASLLGWTKCYAGPYDNTSDPFPACSGSKMLLACRPIGAKTFALVAMGDSSDVTFDTGQNVTVTHEANGVAWYFNPNNAWGFAPAGDSVWNGGPCDVTGINPNTPGPDGAKRMCWTAASGHLSNGYRCGFNSWQNTPGFDSLYERIVYSAP